MRFLAVAVAVCALVIGCSSQEAQVAEEPAQVGFTGVDQLVFQSGGSEGGTGGEVGGGALGGSPGKAGERAYSYDLAADDAEEDAENSAAESAGGQTGDSDGGAIVSQGVKLFPALLPETLNDGEDASVTRVLSLGAAEAVEELHRQGFSSQEICGAPSFIPDFAEAEESTYAVITDENAALTARDAANAVWEYYTVVEQTHREPASQGLLCLSQVAMLPKLEWKWADLRDLIVGETGVSYLLPQRVHVVGLMTGSALAVACLPPLAYGELSFGDAPIASALLLQWAGGRWRVSVAEDSEASDYDNGFCDRHVQAQQAELAGDVADTGERWRLGTWSFTAEELIQTTTQEATQ